jgi:hypothetical protein
MGLRQDALLGCTLRVDINRRRLLGFRTGDQHFSPELEVGTRRDTNSEQQQGQAQSNKDAQ